MIAAVEALFQQQVKTWPRLARGVEGLAQAQTRAVSIDWFEVFIRHIPHRVVSATAAVDPESIAKRPCFLCAENLDPEERCVPFGENYAIYCNPFPIVDRHLSVMHREHRLQRIAGETGNVLDLAAALPGYFVIYNGPECGASAPDHLHFQAGAATFPIFEETERFRDIAVRNYGRNVFRFRDTDRSRLVDKLDHTIELLSEVTGKRPEPMLNIAAFHRDGAWTVFVFPRSKHRPNAYHTGELTISPGTIDLCGLVVAPLEKDFAKLSAADIHSIYREVTLSDSMFEDVASRI